METLATVRNDQHISIVKKAFGDFLQGNINGILTQCSEDIEWGSYIIPAVPFAKTYHGKKGVAEFFSTLAASVDYKVFDTKDFYADQDSVLVRGRQHGTVKSTGKDFNHEFLMHFKLQNEKIIYFFSFVDTKDETEAFTR